MSNSVDIRATTRYTLALFQQARTGGLLDQVEADLALIKSLMEATPQLREMWVSPLIPPGKKRDLILKLFSDQVHSLTLSFLRLLVDKRREDILSAVPDEIRMLSDRERNMLRAEATFAVMPTDTEKQQLSDSLEKRTGKKIELSVRIDDSILGGAMVRLNDTILDGSVRGTLERLREQMLQEV